ncbi:hypothetical protein D0C36_19500 [Mucilaginibacter conchicola]|uniref:Protease n=1 Tax=Mucilaginibacter conchicola TaxID=2303333 RepID=A0A372NQB9_9SPHI|nr:hypothetical protein [Mucilaginibacter conchicola]RFZ91129.1 hypothetical protein D0C36_19500 [Mucilaginibacter conchicola]
MIRQVYISFIAAIIVLTGCHTQKNATDAKSEQSYISEAQKLEVHLSSGNNSGKGSILLSFTVTNPTNKPLRFCKWETPFEPAIGKYFGITDEKGEEALFRGAMARRVMPPPASALTTVPAHGSVKTIIDLADKYELTGHRYTVSYTGGGVSGLKEGNKITLSL